MATQYQQVPDADVETGVGNVPVATPVPLKRQTSRDHVTKATPAYMPTSHFYVPAEQAYQGSHDSNLRNAFIRKVYGILTAQLLLTTMVSAAFMTNEGASQWCVRNGQTAISLSIFPTFASLIGLLCYKDRYPVNGYLLFAFTLSQSLSIGVLCGVYSAAGLGDIILEAFSITATVFLALTLFACQSKYDFTIYNGLLMSILTSLIVWSFFCMMFGFSTGALYSWIGTLLFCGFIVIDTQMIIHKLGYDDYIIASIELYLDIINLFLFILRILGGGRSGRN